MTKMMQKSVLCLALVFAMCLSAAADFDATARHGVAAIYTCLASDKGEVPFGNGTCFFVGKHGENPQYLITNYHVVKRWVELGRGETQTFTLQDGTVLTGNTVMRVYYDAQDYEEAYFVEGDEINDIAILKLENPTTKRECLYPRIPTQNDVGKTVHAVGFPGLADNSIVNATTRWGINDSSVTTGNIGKLFTTSGTGQSLIQINVNILHGNSGGPLVDDNGAVLGITSKGITSTEVTSDSIEIESLNYAVNILEATELLDRNSIPYDEAKPTSQLNPVLLGGVAAVVVAVCIAIFLLKKKRSEVPIQPVVPQPPVAKKPVVMSAAAQHKGLIQSLEGKQVTIGRRGCTIVYEDGTPGVSGQHCSIYWDSASGSFVLTDLGSKYGTFLLNGQQLVAQTPVHLHEGDGFYLGDRANELRCGMV